MLGVRSFKITYTLNAARGFPSLIPLTASASAGSGVTGLRWVALPADQPAGQLPAGIAIENGNSSGNGIDLAPGTSAPMSLRFTASASALETGSVLLTALASDSGNAPRARLRIDYRLSDARPALFATLTYLETGVQQGQSVNAAFTLGNRGLVAAQNVRLMAVSTF